MIVEFIEQLSRRKKQAVGLAVDVVMLPVALWTAFALRLGEWNPQVMAFWPAFVVSALVCIPVFIQLGLYRQVVRYIGSHAMTAVLKGVTITSIAIAAVAYIVPLSGFPRSVPFIFWAISLLYVTGSRFAVRSYVEWRTGQDRGRKPVVIYGAGVNGADLVRRLRLEGMYDPIGFIDDDVTMQKRVIDGVLVSSPESLERFIDNDRVREVLVAVPSTATQDRKRVIEFLEQFAIRVRLIPDIADLISGRESVTDIRDVGVEDLLGRDEVAPLGQLLHGSVKGKSVIVTGAGGSIGSELCRQIVRLEPRLLVLMDQSEYALYEIQRELREIREREQFDLPIVTVLGSVVNDALMVRTLKSYSVDTVYHAAAYKHVDLVEHNVIQGIKNNTFGTLHAAEAAIEAGVERFILISTDKAVRTTNVMGASKRLAELVLQALQTEAGDTCFSMVRFGNVLGSSGSVVPLFLEQIDKGGPVTVTHPDVTRYFMTIPEAASLVLQAASLGEGGDVFILDMGQPVRIVDMARKMIRLKGFTVVSGNPGDGEIAIEYTGLKPGEKLHEELLVGDAAEGTEHRKILRAEDAYVPWSELRGALNTLEQACDTFDYDAIKTFIERLVEGADLAEQLIELAPNAEVLALPPRQDVPR